MLSESTLTKQRPDVNISLKQNQSDIDKYRQNEKDKVRRKVIGINGLLNLLAFFLPLFLKWNILFKVV